ncbi:MAG: hypothetical protein JNN27_00025 [Planctomycetes bacterium]|nr:hypothetical protein [Planctomycetota bacterium]
MSLLNPTPPERLVDAQGRPYFLWDMDLTLERFRELLATGDEATRLHLTAKLMRQAKPDDVFTFLSEAQIRERWPHIEAQLGRSRAFWAWLLAQWERN